jgi:hypothetical protein
LRKNYFSSHKLPKQQSTSFWSQGILGVKKDVPTNSSTLLSKTQDANKINNGFSHYFKSGSNYQLTILIVCTIIKDHVDLEMVDYFLVVTYVGGYTWHGGW